MERSKAWQEEERLIYFPMLALLPRDEAIKKLKEYQKGKDELLAMYAGEFLTEFEMPDTKEAVAKYLKEKEK
jgi:cytochrome c553